MCCNGEFNNPDKLTNVSKAFISQQFSATHQQKTLFKSDCILKCYGSMEATSLIRINTSAFYGAFTDLLVYIPSPMTA